MTPEQHLAIAEQLLQPEGYDGGTGLMVYQSSRVQAAIAHAVMALAGEIGVPHGRDQQTQAVADAGS